MDNDPPRNDDALLEIWFPAFDAQMLLAIADEIEDRADYSERVRVLVRAARKSVDDAVKLLETALGTGRDKVKRREGE